MENAKAIAEKALYLKAQERLHLVELLLYSLDKPDPEIDKVWATEAERRIDALQAGNLKTTPYSEVLKRFGR
ncbi:MAG: addiction module protein [bacterium]|nr:addiction module protein [bacterium]